MRDPNDRTGKENTRAGWLTGLGGAVALLLLLAVGWIGRRYGKTPPGGAPDGDEKGSKL